MDGTRVRTSDSRGQSTQIYVGGGLYMESSTGGTLNLYAPGIGQLVNNVPSIYLADSQGSTVALSGVGGGISGQYKYDAWGNRLFGPSSWQTPLAYVGKEGYVSDPDTGLMKLGARYYDPTIGRFITKDPARDGENWYAYCAGNPVSAIDPTGLNAWIRVSGLARTLGGGLEAVAGYGLASASFTAAGLSSETGIGLVGFGALGVCGVGIGAHGVDTCQAGARQLWSGSNVDSFTSQGLQAAGMSPCWANLTDAGIGFVGSAGAGLGTGAVRAWSIGATDPLAKGLSQTQTLGMWETGSKALNDLDYASLGGQATSPLFKAPYIRAGIDLAGDPLTTTFMQGFGKSVSLWYTGLTPWGGCNGSGTAGL